ncbi:MAG: hypothetical protein IPL65_16325 [Lewinellaceae bacterium]|nr:hypothetical protein [Lewinellaceae bacterium]
MNGLILPSMKSLILIYVVAGLLFGANLVLHGQACERDSIESGGSTSLDSQQTSRNFWTNTRFTGGQLTLPFKIRPKAETNSFRLTTDVTLGGYFGITHVLPGKHENSLTIPMTAGLTFININNNNTSLDRGFEDAEVIPGITWSTGIILQLEHYNLGLMFGKDYASEIGDQWLYHNKLWWSFGIGFSFLN